MAVVARWRLPKYAITHHIGKTYISKIASMAVSVIKIHALYDNLRIFEYSICHAICRIIVRHFFDDKSKYFYRQKSNDRIKHRQNNDRHNNFIMFVTIQFYFSKTYYYLDIKYNAVRCSWPTGISYRYY